MSGQRGSEEPLPRRSKAAAVLALVVLAAFGGLLALPLPGGGTSPPSIAGPAITPVEPPPGSSTAAWYCVGSGGPVAGTILVSAASAGTVRAVVSAANAGGRIGRQGLPVTSGTTVSAPLAAIVGPGPAAATVVVRGGSATVSLQGGDRAGAVPCTRSLSQRWYLAAGSTIGGADLLVSIYDPLPEDAVVNLQVTTQSGSESLPDYQGIVVHAGRERIIDLGNRVLDSSILAVTAQAALGEVVVGGLAIAPRAASLVSAVPATASAWSVPVQVDGSGLETLDEVYNPTSATERVKVTLVSPRAPTVNDVVLVGAGRVLDLTPGSGPGGSGGVLSSGWFRCLGGGQMVVESGLRVVGSQGYRGPVDAGVPASSLSWVLGSVPVPSGTVVYLVVDSRGGAPVSLSLSSLAGVPFRSAELAVPAGRPLVLNVSGEFPSGLAVHAKHPVVLGALTVVSNVGPSVLALVRSG